MPAGKVPTFFFNLRSPYSWLAYHDLLERHPGVAATLDWVPYFDPDERTLALLDQAGGQYLYTPMSRAKHLYILQDIRRLAAQRGLEFTWPVDRKPVWEIPHLAYIVARQRGRGPEFIAHAYRARWQEGRDICDRVTVAAIGAALGLGSARLADAADDAEVRAAGLEALLAVDRAGAFGVPFFVHGYDKFWGVDRVDAFVARVTGRAPEVRGGWARTSVPGGAVPAEDHAGGCG